MSKQNGGIIGPDNVPTGAFGAASGVWKLSDVTNYKRQGTWPVPLTGHQVANSCRFNVASTDYLNESQSNGNRKTYTWSCWFKRSTLATFQLLWHCNNAGHYSYFGFDGDDNLIYYAMDGSTNQGNFKSTRVFRDASAWYHIVARIDTTESSSGDRLRFYINGEQITSWDTSSQPMSQNTDTEMNVSGHTFRIGTYNNSSSWLGGYLAECVFIDGQSLAPDQFGETDSATNNWVPKDVSGLTFGTNGFYLDFKDSSALGNDAAGSNNFTANNLTSIDQSIDTCTNNFATINPLYVGLNANFGISEGNLKGLNSGNGENNYVSTIAPSSGKWYFEAKATVDGNAYATLGIVATDSVLQTNGSWLGSTNDSWFYNQGGSIGTNGSASSSAPDSYTTNDIISVAVNLDDNEITWYKNGAVQNSGTALALTSGKSYFFGGRVYSGSTGWEFNFGSPPYAISSGNVDSSGMGNFEYAVPSGYYSLCTRNLNLIG